MGKTGVGCVSAYESARESAGAKVVQVMGLFLDR